MSNDYEPQQPSIWRADLPPIQINEQPLGCQPSFDVLFQFLDGVLDGVQQTDVQQHLDDCPDCSLAYEAQAHLKHMLASSCRIDPPPGLADKVFAAVLASGGGEQPSDVQPVDAQPIDDADEAEAAAADSDSIDSGSGDPDGASGSPSDAEMTSSGTDNRSATESETA